MKGLETAEILLVEDNADDAELALRALRKRGITVPVRVSRDGAEAIEYFFGAGSGTSGETVRIPQIVLLDLKLPKVGGLEVLRRLRQDERTRAVPVVVLTSSREEADVRQAYLSGANSYIVKPVDFESFMEVVGMLCHYWLELNQGPVR
jgi:two-component system response regulator